ncbi:hypothetical protein NKI25_18590 [Mesorhizobium sp. M0808]|uniref:hypothetical protein n=1 Tax=Mesorhizobium sp. M0808 TaxID=2957002 RepID=UPI0033382614
MMDLPGYDAWKTRTPWDDCDEEPELRCEECNDTGFIDPDELCPVCMRPVTAEDLDALAMEEDF